MKARSTIFRAVSLFAALIMNICIAYCQTDEFVDALFLYAKGDFNGAAALLEKEIENNPDNDAAYYYLASVCGQLDDGKARIAPLLKKAIELAPDNYWYKYALAIHYENNDEMELASLTFEQLLADYPKKSGLYVDVVNSYIRLGETDRALETVRKLEQIRGKNEMFAMTTLDLMSRRPNADADSIYAFLLDYYKDCKTPRMATLLGDYYLSSYKDSLAMDYYGQAVDMDPEYTPAYFGMAQVNQANRQYDSFFTNMSYFMKDPAIAPEAKIEFLQSVLDSPQFVRNFLQDVENLVNLMRNANPAEQKVNSFLSTYYYSLGRQDEALEVLKANVDLFPESYQDALQYLILIYYCQYWGMLVDSSTELLLRFPYDLDFLQLRAIAYTQLDQADLAIADHEAILRSRPKDTTVVVSTNASLGDLYYKSGDQKKAYSFYDKALKINPDYLPVLNNYAYYLSLSGKNLKKARQMSYKTVQAEPDNPTYLDTYAWILHLLGQDLEAKAMFKHAMLYGGKESKEILSHYADVLDALGEKDLADIYRNQAKVMQE